MIDERTEELASLHAFDLLEGAERTAFEARLVRDPELQALVRGLREATAALAFTAPAATPSPALRARALAHATSVPGPRTLTPVTRFPMWIPYAAAAGFALACLWLGQRVLSARAEADRVGLELRLADIARREAENALTAERIILNQQIANTTRQLADAQRGLTGATEQLAANNLRIAHLNERLADLGGQLKKQGDLAQFKIATLSSMLGNTPQALAVAVWNPAQQEGIFTVDKLPAAGADQDYELWVIDAAQPKPISGGVFVIAADGETRVQFKTEAPVATIAKFAVSREKKGGAPRLGGPQGTVIMISQ
jgi:anti-sigma-K factor RskA